MYCVFNAIVLRFNANVLRFNAIVLRFNANVLRFNANVLRFNAIKKQLPLKNLARLGFRSNGRILECKILTAVGLNVEWTRNSNRLCDENKQV